MKTVQINKVKVRIFEEDELRVKLGMVEKDVELVSKHQRIFPELLQDDNKGFINSARKLYIELGLNESHWSRWSDKNIVESKFFSKNEDWKVLAMRETTSKGGQTANDYKITIEMAKHLCMKVDNKSGHDFRQYFIIIEKTLRDYEKWCEVREPEKQEFNVMVEELKKWCDRNGYDVSDDKRFKTFRIRESNMMNEHLMDKIASEIKSHIGYKDNITRDHLDEKQNSALRELQTFNTNLLIANMDFEKRSDLIKQICETKYSNMKF